MFGKHWVSARGTIVASHTVKTTGDGMVSIHGAEPQGTREGSRDSIDETLAQAPAAGPGRWLPQTRN